MATLRKRKVTRGDKEYLYWVVDFSTTQDGKTKRKQRHFTDRQKAQLFKAEIDRQIARAKYANMEVPMGPPEATLIEWLDRFAKSVRPNCSDVYHRTIVSTLKEFRKFLADEGVHNTRNLRREHVSGYAEWQLGEVKPKTASNKMQIVKRAVRWGVDEEIIPQKVARRMPNIKVPKKRRRVLSEGEMEKVIELFEDDPLYPVVLTALYTGIRRGELVQMRCKDVDLESGRIQLPADITKNDRPRTIGIHNRLSPVLADLMREPNDLVFHLGGRKSRRAYISHHFSDVAQEKEGMEDLTFHCLRHTCATRLAAAGMNPFDVQRVMGHQSIKTTMIYVNLAQEQTPDMNII